MIWSYADYIVRNARKGPLRGLGTPGNISCFAREDFSDFLFAFLYKNIPSDKETTLKGITVTTSVSF